MDHLNNEFQKLILKNKELNSFVENSCICGYWLINENNPTKIKVSKTFYAFLGYASNEELVITDFDKASFFNHLDQNNIGFKFSFTHKLGYNILFDVQKFPNILLTNQTLIGFNFIELETQLFNNSNFELIQAKEMLVQAAEVSKVGGWDLEVNTNQLIWTDITKVIHEVPHNYEPNIDNAIQFYKQGFYRDKIKELVKNLLEKGIPFDEELLIITYSGSEKWVRAIGTAKFIEGKCEKIYGTFQDIDHLKKIELENKQVLKLIQNLTEELPAGLYQFQMMDDGTISFPYLSKGFLNLFEVAEFEFKENPHLAFSMIYDEDLEMVNNSIEQSAKNLEKWSLNFRVRTTSKELIWIKGESNPERLENGFIWHGYMLDITLQKHTEIALQNAIETANLASNSKSDFLANMSHEIRTPLNGVIGFIDLLMKTKLDAMQLQYMETVFQSANSLLDIINDILDFSKIEAGKLELSLEEIDLFELGGQVTDIVKFQAHAKKLEILLNVAPNLPQFVLADSIRLRQILVNLLGNAIKFTEKGEIELKVEQLNSGNALDTQFRFSVKDTGVGIDSKNLTKIFEAFSQEDASTSRKFGGTGLGLTISNKLLSLMGSKLELKSDVGVGSVFYFDIKLKSKQGSNQANWKQLKNINKVLIVDDNVSNRNILQKMFSLRYLQIETVKNGIEALEKLNENNRYDVILMDYNMPYLDGIETVRNIREKLQLSANKLPIILLNNSTEDENLNKICDELAIQYKLIKPIKLNQLYDCLVQIQNKDNEVKAPLTEPKKQEINKDLVNILIADDNQINMMLTKSIFKNILPNAVIKEAQNGVEAVSMFVKHNPDIVFMDIQMPEMNGYKAATEIRKFEKDGRVPIVALTAGTVVGEKERCLRAGMDDYISKPVITETIINTINKWLEYSNGIYKKKENMETNETDKHFDFEKLKERLDQDVELISQLLVMTKEYLVDFLPILDDLIAKNDRAAIKSHAHKLKGTALSVCFNELAMLLLEFEKLDNYDDYNFISLRAKISTEAEYLIQMINEREG